MTDEAERLLGILDERTKSIQSSVHKIEANITDLFNRGDAVRSRLDTLTAEHKQRLATGLDCNQTVNVPPISKAVMAYVGGSGVVGAGLVLIIMLLLKRWGLL